MAADFVCSRPPAETGTAHFNAAVERRVDLWISTSTGNQRYESGARIHADYASKHTAGFTLEVRTPKAGSVTAHRNPTNPDLWKTDNRLYYADR